ncbi:hypothetical protein RHMOL_Rhmol03G0037000 [Rhododendron molle]|uniref:Uncharacterized protein n=1 Tax=Rhododendron molle TaxID=49168 RepID=A0ACC0PBA3_RHOML|nr:hypothetical protein RHMOL_Rhmol03G0037000 [Rhododendron molle]
MHCYKLVSLPAGLRHLISLEVLKIHSCESLNFSDDDDFKGLTSLNTLSLKDLRGLVSLPKGLQDAAATLTHLDILECLNFTSPSESVLPNLLSLQSLTIRECHKVESLPEGMQRLTKLLNLTIYSYNLNTSSYREGREDWPKIAHIPRIQIVDNNYSEHSSPDTINHCAYILLKDPAAGNVPFRGVVLLGNYTINFPIYVFFFLPLAEVAEVASSGAVPRSAFFVPEVLWMAAPFKTLFPFLL